MSNNPLIRYVLVTCAFALLDNSCLAESSNNKSSTAKEETFFLNALIQWVNEDRSHSPASIEVGRGIMSSDDARKAFDELIEKTKITTNFGKKPTCGPVKEEKGYYYARITNQELPGFLVVKKGTRFVFVATMPIS